MKKRKIVVIIVALLILLSGLITQIIFVNRKTKPQEEQEEFKNINIQIHKEVVLNQLQFSDFLIRTCDDEVDGTCVIDLSKYTFSGNYELNVEHPNVVSIRFFNPLDQTISSFSYQILLYNKDKELIMTLNETIRDIEGNAEGMIRILTPVDLSKVKDYKLELQKDANQK